MKFFSDIKNSIYNPQYYQDLLAKPFSYSLKYFLLLALLLAMLHAGAVCFSILPNLKLGIDALQSGVVNHFPADLEVTIAKGKVSTNVKELYVIKFSAGLDVKKNNPSVENMLTIDTKNAFSLDQFGQYKTLCWLGQKALSCYDKNGAITITPLDTMPDVKINKALIESFAAKVRPFIPLMYPLVVVVLFATLFVAYCFSFLYLIIGALLIWLAAKITNITIGYKKSYQLGLHLVTLPLIISLVISVATALLPIQIHTFFLFPTAVLVILAFLNIKKSKNNISATTN